ncbi:unnamed protein product, partial [Hymenolepis diminuta]
CKICSKSFVQAYTIRKHVQSVHENSFQCDECDRAFGYKRGLQFHVDLIHRKVKDFKCKVCEKSFSERGHLKRHVITMHKAFVEFKCEICAKSFSKAAYLRKHVLGVHESKHSVYSLSLSRSLSLPISSNSRVVD